MILLGTAIAGAFEIELEEQVDERGFFARTFDASVLERAGLVHRFDQHSLAYNTVAGTLRGLHFQAGDAPEAKIVRCTRGALYDVTLDAQNRRALYIPPGCAHGYQTTQDGTEATYLISAPYEPAMARGIHYADPGLAIAWPLAVACISQRDASLPRLSELG